jgi:ribosomal protein L16 Arg81 hydroxylase
MPAFAASDVLLNLWKINEEQKTPESGLNLVPLPRGSTVRFMPWQPSERANSDDTRIWPIEFSTPDTESLAAGFHTAGESTMAIERFDLSTLLRPVELKSFFRDSWERRPLAISRDDPNFYRGLFTLGDVDNLIAFTRPKFFDNLQSGANQRSNVVRGWLADEEAYAGSYPDVRDVHRAVAHGKTLLITGMQQRCLTVAALGRNLEAQFGCRVHTNLYLTPPGAQGFEAHFDTHEVFVLQIDGDKHWRLYSPTRELPTANDHVPVQKHQLGAPTQEIDLHAGDLLYIPRGHVHEAFTSERESLHLTVGVNVHRWVDLLQQALASAASADVAFRRSLPPGILCGEAPPPELSETFQELLRSFANSASLEGAFETMARSFVGRLAALPDNYFAGADPDQIRLDTLVERALGVICRVAIEGEKAILHAPDTHIDGPSQIAPALRYIARTERFTPSELPGELTPDAKLALVRRLFRENLVTNAKPATGDGSTP